MHNESKNDLARPLSRCRATRVGVMVAAVAAFGLLAACVPAGQSEYGAEIQPNPPSVSHSATPPAQHNSKADPKPQTNSGGPGDTSLPQIGQVCTAKADWRNNSIACWSNPSGPTFAFSVGAYALHDNDTKNNFAFHYTINNVDGQVARGDASNGDQLALTLRKGDTLNVSLPASADVYSLMVEAVAAPPEKSKIGRPPSPTPSVNDVCAMNNTDALTECWALPWDSIDRYNTTVTNPDEPPATYFLFNPDGSRSPDYTLRQGESLTHGIRPGDMIFGKTLGAVKITTLQDTNPTAIPLPSVGATCFQPGTTNVEAHPCWRITSVGEGMEFSIRNAGSDATYEIRNSDGLVAGHALAAGHTERISIRPSDTLSILTTHSTTTLTLEP